MNVWDFRELAILAGKDGEYAINDMLTESCGTPNNMTVIEPTRDPRGSWTTFFAERGEISDRRFFASEDEACRFILDRDMYVTKPPMSADSLTTEERAVRQQETKARNETYTSVLRAKGIIS